MMVTLRFIFLEVLKAVALVFLGLLATKAAANLNFPALGRGRARGRWARGLLYAVILTLVILGARGVGEDVAAQNYMWASRDNLVHGQYPNAQENAERAVRLRPGVIRYWQTLAAAKLLENQCESLVGDWSAFQTLSGGTMQEEDTYRFAVCYFSLAQYDRVVPLTQKLIQENRSYLPPYVLQGMAYLGQKKYPQARQSFLDVLQMFPSHQAAVEGLAQAYFLEGNRAGALAVLNETAKYGFPAEARKRFEALKMLYAQ